MHLLVRCEVDRRDLAGGRGMERHRPVRPGRADGLDACAFGPQLHRLDEDGDGTVSTAAALRGPIPVRGRHQRPAVLVRGDAKAAQSRDEHKLFEEAHSNSWSPMPNRRNHSFRPVRFPCRE